MRGINLLHPILNSMAKVFAAECLKAGIKIRFLDTLRDQKEQDSIPGTNTKAKFPFSMHNWGLAFDVVIIDKNGQLNWSNIELYKKIGQIGKKLGLFWGGDFTTQKGDYGHFQLNKFGLTKDLVKKYGKPEVFIKTFKK